MAEEKATPDESTDSIVGYSYPRDLAVFVQDRWKSPPETVRTPDLCPRLATLEAFFSACYHASMVGEEERPVTFRAIFASPSLFQRNQRPPDGLQVLEFKRCFLFNPEELRRLSVAADPERTLICVQADENAEARLRIWGIIISGTRWLRDVKGGRRAGFPLPSAPVVRVEAPGIIAAYQGDKLLGRLHGGRLSGSRVDLFESKWLPLEFSEFRNRKQTEIESTAFIINVVPATRLVGIWDRIRVPYICSEIVGETARLKFEGSAPDLLIQILLEAMTSRRPNPQSVKFEDEAGEEE